jgi:uncharacterized protein (UPF0262 family)
VVFCFLVWEQMRFNGLYAGLLAKILRVHSGPVQARLVFQIVRFGATTVRFFFKTFSQACRAIVFLFFILFCAQYEGVRHSDIAGEWPGFWVA